MHSGSAAASGIDSDSGRLADCQFDPGPAVHGGRYTLALRDGSAPATGDHCVAIQRGYLSADSLCGRIRSAAIILIARVILWSAVARHHFGMLRRSPFLVARCNENRDAKIPKLHQAGALQK